MEKDRLRGVRVGVLAGGVSEEREISLESGRCSFYALQDSGVETVFIDINTSVPDKVKELIRSEKINVAFIALHGHFGEDGKIQEILEDLSILYTGSRPLSSYRAMDKISSKQIFLRHAIPTAQFTVWHDKDNLPEYVTYPVVVKPFFSGSSLGVSIVREKKDLKKAIQQALNLQDKVVLEDYIEGRELTVGILDENALGVVEIVPKSGYYDFHTKYTDGMAQFVCPADLADDIYKKVQQTGLAAHKALECRHFSRVDMRLSDTNDIYVLEVNSIPGLTSHSLLPLSAQCCGIDFNSLILTMVELALHGKIKTQKEC